MSFHSFRDGNFDKKTVGLLESLFLWHDRHPLPPYLNRFIRDNLLPPLRYWKYRLKNHSKITHTLKAGKTALGDAVVPDERIIEQDLSFQPMPWTFAVDWFQSLHEMNEYLHNNDGSWSPQPHANYFGKGISIEDVALRIYGYILAYRATGENLYLDRALMGSNYLLKKRRLGDGHLVLQGHTVIDTTYSFAAIAWIMIWEETGDKTAFQAAHDLGKHLCQYQIAGSINHAAIPAQALALLYGCTGDLSYLHNALKRVARVMPYQQPYGGWPEGHESWTWYHSITTKSVNMAYVYTPFTIDYQAIKDKMAHSLYKALNRLITSQQKNGRIKSGCGDLLYDERDEYGSSPRAQWAEFNLEHGFIKAPPVACHEFYGYELDSLCYARLSLPCPELDPIIEGLAGYFSRRRLVWRPEFNTMAIGHYLYYRKYLSNCFPGNRTIENI